MTDNQNENRTLEKLYAFMESDNDMKIAKAIKLLQANPEFMAKAEKRYLNLVRARAGEKAGLESFNRKTFSQSDVDLLKGRNFSKNTISLSYFSVAECEAVVFFLGSLVLNHLDSKDFSKQAEAAETEAELVALYSKAANTVRNGILEETRIHPEGWFSKLSTRFASYQIEQVLFEKTDFTIPDSPHLKAFLFYVGMNNPEFVYLDIFQSYVSGLSDFFWFLPNVPKSSWGDTELNFPDCKLKFQRIAIYRLGDSQPWKRKKFPESK